MLGDGRRLATLEPGDFFGEVGLLITGRRTASVVSLTPMRMVAMFDQCFRRLERELPDFAESVRAACMERCPAPSASGCARGLEYNRGDPGG